MNNFWTLLARRACISLPFSVIQVQRINMNIANTIEKFYCTIRVNALNHWAGIQFCISDFSRFCEEMWPSCGILTWEPSENYVAKLYGTIDVK